MTRFIRLILSIKDKEIRLDLSVRNKPDGFESYEQRLAQEEMK